MFDRYAIRILKGPLESCSRFLGNKNIRADQVTVISFAVGIMVLPALYLQCYGYALVLIVLNRVGDGIDGVLARMSGVSDGGGFLDIVLDFIFYAAVVFGFALADPGQNALAASLLLFSFMGTGASFLAFAIFAEKRKIENIVYPHKGIYYMAGLTEGAETITCFVLFCLFPDKFAFIAYCFASLCLVTTVTRVVGGYFTLTR